VSTLCYDAVVEVPNATDRVDLDAAETPVADLLGDTLRRPRAGHDEQAPGHHLRGLTSRRLCRPRLSA